MRTHSPADAKSRPATATPEDKVVHLAKQWREAEKKFMGSKTSADSRKEYFARRILREAIDRMML